jgi:hypothetical protein
MTGIWRPIDLMTVRDAAVADIVPEDERSSRATAVRNPRLIYNLGTRCSSSSKRAGARKASASSCSRCARRSSAAAKTPTGSVQAERRGVRPAVREVLKDRFKPFRDKERPADYGRNLAPTPRRRRSTARTHRASPSGDLIAVATGNRKDGELDIVLLSAKDGSVIRNLTNGFDQDKGFEFLITPACASTWCRGSPGRRRRSHRVLRPQEKTRTLILQNILNRNVDSASDMKTVDDPESPDILARRQEGGIRRRCRAASATSSCSISTRTR